MTHAYFIFFSLLFCICENNFNSPTFLITTHIGCCPHALPLLVSLVVNGLHLYDTLVKTNEPISSVQLLSCVQIFATLWTAACQASLSITNSQSLLKPMSIELVMPSNHLILCRPLLLFSIFPSIKVFSNESILHIRWPKY